MKLAVLCLSIAGAPTFSQSLQITPGADEIELQWQRTFPPNAGVPTWKEYQIFSSSDLSTWSEHSMIRADDAEGAGLATLRVPIDQTSLFFRMEEKLVYGHRTNDSGEPSIYERQYLNSHQPSLSLAQFVEQTADPNCLDSIDWDPTDATFFTEYNTPPQDHNANLAPDDPERRIYDFTLSDEELSLYQKNGFVVSPRVKSYEPFDIDGNDVPHILTPNAVDLYYAIWTDDLPVFITADSVLDAWHQTFISMLEELDEIAIHPSIKQLIKLDWDTAFSTTTSAWDAENATPEENSRVQQAIDDVTFYLDVAKAFLDTTPPTHSPEALDWYTDLIDPDPSQLRKFGLFGDVSRINRPNLYKPRGRFTRSGVLAAHFRTVVWLSRAQFHIAHSNGNNRDQRDRELRAAALLALTIRDGGLLDDWRKIEQMLQGIAGQSDAMTIPEMIALLESLSLDSLATIASETDLDTLRTALLASNYGVQEVNGGYYEPEAPPGTSVCNPPAIEQPRALSLFGQRWTPDAWNFQKVVFPEVREDGVANYRRMPSGLDVAFSTLGNDTAAPILIERMLDSEGVPFRDGYPYHQNLATVRSTLDSQEEAFWTEHIYGSWLHSLRSLSGPLTPSAPDTFHTTAWKRRILNTQLASWTHLRHDTLLYAKQSFTPPVVCEFPDGYVDPYPEMWQRLSDMALAFRGFIDTFDFDGNFRISLPLDGFYPPDDLSYLLLSTAEFDPQNGYPPAHDWTEQINRGERVSAMKVHLSNFSDRCLTLKAIAENQLAGLPHTEDMKDFIADTVEDFELIGYVGYRLYNGWFPNLYFENYRASEGEHPSAVFNPVVVDVHTDGVDLVCSGDPGGILHEGTGRVQFMLTAVKHPDGSSCAYGGPVMSHYEFTTPLGVRMSDEEWKQQLDFGNEPQFDAWKHSFMVPIDDE